jgi:hypothetical protein
MPPLRRRETTRRSAEKTHTVKKGGCGTRCFALGYGGYFALVYNVGFDWGCWGYWGHLL